MRWRSCPTAVHQPLQSPRQHRAANCPAGPCRERASTASAVSSTLLAAIPVASGGFRPHPQPPSAFWTAANHCKPRWQVSFELPEICAGPAERAPCRRPDFPPPGGPGCQTTAGSSCRPDAASSDELPIRDRIAAVTAADRQVSPGVQSPHGVGRQIAPLRSNGNSAPAATERRPAAIGVLQTQQPAQSGCRRLNAAAILRGVDAAATFSKRATPTVLPDVSSASGTEPLKSLQPQPPGAAPV